MKFILDEFHRCFASSLALRISIVLLMRRVSLWVGEWLNYGGEADLSKVFLVGEQAAVLRVGLTPVFTSGKTGCSNSFMSLITANHTIRIARPTRSVNAAERFWCEGVGLKVLWRTGTEAVGGHSLLMVGIVGAPWHLELVENPDTLDANPPSAEDLLVVYRGHPINQTEIQQLILAGGKVVPARNPYWDKYGITIEDPDGYRLVLSHRTWGHQD